MNDPQKAWQLFAEIREKPTSIPIAPGVLFKHFEAVSDKPGAGLLPLPPSFESPRQDDLGSNNFSLEELERALKETKVGTSPGPDGLSPELIQYIFGNPQPKLWLLRFVNLCFEAGYVPHDWCESELFVMYKNKGDVKVGDSYRAISLTAVLGKIYERLLAARLQLWLKGSKLVKLPQFGFWTKSSVTDAVFVVRSLVQWHKYVHKKPCHAVFIDLKKAFPSMNRTSLFDRLRDLGVSETLIRSMSAFYTGNKARLRLGVLLTAFFLVKTGLSEGRVLSPPLFSLAFSVIWEKLEACEFPEEGFMFSFESFWFVAFADDLVVLSSSKAKLNVVLGKLAEVLRVFDLIISETKSEGMTFTPGGRIVLIDQGNSGTKIGNHDVVFVPKFKYLGVWLTPDLKYGVHLAAMDEKARLASIEMAGILRNLEVKKWSKLSLFFTMFVESQYFGMELLPAVAGSNMKSTRGFFLNKTLGLTKSFPSKVVEFLLNLYPPEVKLLKARLSLFRRLESHEIAHGRKALELTFGPLLEKRVGWGYESFILLRKINPRMKFEDFSFVTNAESFLSNFPSATEIAFEFLKRLAGSSSELTFFLFLESIEAASSFRLALEKLSFDHIRIVLLFVTSQI